MAIEAVPPADAQLQAWEYFLRAFGQMGWQSQLILAGLLITLVLILVTNVPGLWQRLRGGGDEDAKERDDAPPAASAGMVQLESIVNLTASIIERVGNKLEALSASLDQHATYSIQAQTALLETMKSFGETVRAHTQTVIEENEAIKELIKTMHQQMKVLEVPVYAQQERLAAFTKAMAGCADCHKAHAPGREAQSPEPVNNGDDDDRWR